MPHAPQLARSVFVSTQVLLHTVWLPGQATAHALFTHASPVAQLVAHVPQWRASLVRSIQLRAPPEAVHTVSPVAQVEAQVPFEQTSPFSHA